MKRMVSTCTAILILYDLNSDPDYRTFLTSLLPPTSFLERLLYFFSSMFLYSSNCYLASLSRARLTQSIESYFWNSNQKFDSIYCLL